MNERETRTATEDRPMDTVSTEEEERQAVESLARRQREDRSSEPAMTGDAVGGGDAPDRADRPTPTGTAAMAQAAEERDEREPDRANDAGPADEEAQQTPLFDEKATESYRGRWQEVQTRFVDDPPKAVAEADVLVADLMQSLAKTFAEERNRLESDWKRGEDVSTEDLRLALRRYRSFFGRLLSV
jgi:hypothetical protein